MDLNYFLIANDTDTLPNQRFGRSHGDDRMRDRINHPTVMCNFLKWFCLVTLLTIFLDTLDVQTLYASLVQSFRSEGSFGCYTVVYFVNNIAFPFLHCFRHWSKKYPICIILNENEKIQVLEKESAPSDKKGDVNRPDEKKKHAESSHDVESTETNTSPEKKKKFVWRRRDKRGSLEKEGR